MKKISTVTKKGKKIFKEPKLCRFGQQGCNSGESL